MDEDTGRNDVYEEHGGDGVPEDTEVHSSKLRQYYVVCPINLCGYKQSY